MTKVRDMVIQENDATRIREILQRFLSESAAIEALLIDRSGQLLAMDGVARALDTVSISALAADSLRNRWRISRIRVASFSWMTMSRTFVILPPSRRRTRRRGPCVTPC